MANKKTIHVDVEANASQVARETKKASKQVVDTLGSLQAFEKQVGSIHSRIAGLMGSTGKTIRETERDIQRLNDLMSKPGYFSAYNRTTKMVSSGGLEAQQIKAELSGFRSMMSTSLPQVQQEVERIMAKEMKARLKMLNDAMTRGTLNGFQLGSLDSSLTQAQQRKNAQSAYKLFGSQFQKTVVNDDGKRTLSPEYRSFIQEVERLRVEALSAQKVISQKELTHQQKLSKQAQERRKKEVATQNKLNQIAQKEAVAAQKQFNEAIVAEKDQEKRRKLESQARVSAYDAAARARTKFNDDQRKIYGDTYTPISYDQNTVRGALDTNLNRAKQKAEFRPTPTASMVDDDPLNGVRKTLDRFDAAGGAGIFAIQAKLMANYQLMSSAINTIGFAGRFSIDLEKSLANVQSIASATSFEMKLLSGTILDTAGNMNIAADLVSDSATLMAQAGASAQDISSGLPNITNLAVATGTDLTKTVDIVTSTVSVFNLQMSESSQIANVLTAVMNKSKLGMDQFALGLQYSGNLANSSGISFNELAAALGGMADSGIKAGSTMGTGLRRLLLELQKPSQKARDIFASLGITLNDIDVKGQGLFGVLENLRDAGFGTAEAMGAFEIRAANAYAALTNNLANVRDLNEGILGTSAATEAAAIQMDTMHARGVQLANTFGSLIFQNSEMLREGIKGLTLGLTSLLQSMNDLTILGPVLEATLGGAMVGAFVAVTVWIGKLIGGLLTLDGKLEATRVKALQTSSGVASIGTAAEVATSKLKGMGTFATRIASSWTVWGIALGALAPVLIDVFNSAENGAKRAAERLDEYKGKLNETTNSISTTDQAIGALDKTTERLLVRSANLTEGSRALGDATREVSSRFKEYGLQLKDNVTDVFELVEAIGVLRSEMLKTKGFQLVTQQQQLENDTRERASQLANSVSRRVLEQTNHGTAKIPSYSYTVGVREGLLDNTNLSGLGLDPTVLANFNQVAHLYRSQTERSHNLGNSRYYGLSELETAELFNQEMEVFWQVKNALETGLKRGQTNTSAAQAALEDIKNLMNTFALEQNLANDIIRNQRDMDQNFRDQRLVHFEQSPEYQEFTRRAANVWTEISGAEKTILDKNPTASERAASLLELKEQFSPAIEQLQNLKQKMISGLAEDLEVSMEIAQDSFNSLHGGAKYALQLQKRTSNNFLDPELNQTLIDMVGSESDAAQAKMAAIEAKGRIVGRLGYEEAADIHAAAMDTYIESELSKSRLELFKNGHQTADGGLDSHGQDIHDVLALKLESERQKKAADLKRIYQSDPNRVGSREARRALNAEANAKISLKQQEIKALEAEMKSATEHVDQHSSLEEIRDALKIYKNLSQRWEDLKLELRELKSLKIDLEKPEQAKKLKADLLQETEKEISEVTKLGYRKLLDLFEETKQALERRKLNIDREQQEANLTNLLDDIAASSEVNVEEVVKRGAAYIERLRDIALKLFDEAEENINRLDDPAALAERERLNSSFDQRLTNLTIEASNAGISKPLGTNQYNQNTRNLNRESDRFEEASSVLGHNSTWLQFFDVERAKQDSELLKNQLDEMLVAQERYAQRVAEISLQLATASEVKRQALVEERSTLQRTMEVQAEAIEDQSLILDQVSTKAKGVYGDLTEVSTWATLSISSVFSSLSSNLEQALDDIVMGSASIEDSFKSLGLGILETLKDMAIKILANQMIMWIISMFGFGSGSGSGYFNTYSAGNLGGLDNTGGNGYQFKGFNTGGLVQGKSIGRDSVPILAEDQEFVLRKSAAQSIGTNKLRQLNAYGAAALSPNVNIMQMSEKREPDTVNVWVVSKDRVPSPSRRDIITIIQEDVASNGPTKRLIKSVAVGSI